MKTPLFLFLSFFAIATCTGQTEIPTTEGGWTMTATVDGKPWEAATVIPPAQAGRVIGSYKDGYINLPYWKQWKAGKQYNISETSAALFMAVGKPVLWTGRIGQIQVTKLTDAWLEGTFYFTATTTGSDKKVEVTNGFFRVSTKKP